MRKISNYQLFTELQHGPITRVYKAIQPELQRVVLVKQLNPDLVSDAELVERFKQEGLVLAKINSPHVITIFDFGYDDSVPFLVTEFVEGNTLAQLVQKNGVLPWDIGLLILQQLTQGLSAIHHRNIIHQDIKPDNIFISNEGEIKLGDLGFSVPLEKIGDQILGTPAYLPPEVILGPGADLRSDLYALGLVGYEILTGDNPFAAEDMRTVFNRIINLNPVIAHTINPDVPEQLSTIITTLMARNPAERFSSATALYQELEKLKLSTGIKVDGNSLISYIAAPESYHLSRSAPLEIEPKSKQQPITWKQAVLPMSIVFIGVVIILISRLFNDGRGLLTGNLDSTRVANKINFNQPEKPGDSTIVSDRLKNNNRETHRQTESLTVSFDRSTKKDTLEINQRGEAKNDSIWVTSDPRAVVFKNGDSLGITPFKLFADKNRACVLEFRTPGFPYITKNVTFSEPVVQEIHINLWTEVGYLDIDIIPWGEIWIDDDSIDVSPINRPIILTYGNHKLTVRHPSLKNVTEPIYVAVGETLKKEIQLQRRH